MTGWDNLFDIQDAYDKLARGAAFGGEMKLTNEQAVQLQQKIIDLALSVVTLKRKDYSGDADPFANFRRSAIFGVPAWKGCLIRLMDKLSRIYQITEAGAMYVKDETLLDSSADAINYICILMGLICEELGLQEEWLTNQDICEEEPTWEYHVPYAGGGEDYDGEGTS